LSLPAGAKVLAPVAVSSTEAGRVVAISNEGRMLVFDAASLPQMAKGKGNKMISIPSARAAQGEELVVAMACVQPEDLLVALSGKRFMNFTEKDLQEYMGERGRRGLKLPRGFQRIDGLEVKVGEGKVASSATPSDPDLFEG